MDDLPVHRNHDGLGRVDDAIDVVLPYFTIVPTLAGNGDDSAGIEPVDMGAADADHAAVHLDAAHELRGFDRL